MVTAQDGTTTITYTVDVIDAGTDATLSGLWLTEPLCRDLTRNNHLYPITLWNYGSADRDGNGAGHRKGDLDHNSRRFDRA